MPGARGACGDCHFFLDDEVAGWREREGDGECRRHPPVVQASCCNLWPRVRLADWCGDFRRREPPPLKVERGGD